MASVTSYTNPLAVTKTEIEPAGSIFALTMFATNPLATPPAKSVFGTGTPRPAAHPPILIPKRVLDARLHVAHC
jgi:hypothetical protein